MLKNKKKVIKIEIKNKMDTMKAEVLSVVVSKIQTNRDAVMLEINLILNGTLNEGSVDKLIYKIQELSTLEKSLEQANSFYAQSVAQLARKIGKPELAEKVQEILDKTQEIKTEEANDNTA